MNKCEITPSHMVMSLTHVYFRWVAHAVLEGLWCGWQPCQSHRVWLHTPRLAPSLIAVEAAPRHAVNAATGQNYHMRIWADSENTHANLVTHSDTKTSGDLTVKMYFTLHVNSD